MNYFWIQCVYANFDYSDILSQYNMSNDKWAQVFDSKHGYCIRFKYENQEDFTAFVINEPEFSQYIITTGRRFYGKQKKTKLG